MHTNFMNCIRKFSTIAATPASLPAPVPLHFVKVDAVERLHNIPLVVLHGLFGNHQNWRSIVGKTALTATRDAYILDARNHGRSPWDPAMSYDAMASDLLHFLDQNNIEKAHILGHSMGGKTAMHASLIAPSRFHTLTVVDVSPVSYYNSPNWQIPKTVHAMRSLDLATLEKRSQAEQFLADRVSDHRTRIFLLTNLVREETESGQGVWRWRMNLDAVAESLDLIGGFPEWLKESPDGLVAKSSRQGPTLFVRGSRSEHVKEKHHAAIKTLFPTSHTHTVDNAGHWVHSEQTEEFVRVVGRFLMHHP